MLWASRVDESVTSKKQERATPETAKGIGEMASVRWGYARIITGTILGGVLGFYVMHRLELSYKEKVKERLRRYEAELKSKEQHRLDDSPSSSSS